jgi:hypothetical protein
MVGPSRTKSAAKREPTPEDSEVESEGDDITVEEAWESSASDVLILMERLKEELADIDIGIGDKITLVKFTRFIEANSTNLS